MPSGSFEIHKNLKIIVKKYTMYITRLPEEKVLKPKLKLRNKHHIKVWKSKMFLKIIFQVATSH